MIHFILFYSKSQQEQAFFYNKFRKKSEFESIKPFLYGSVSPAVVHKPLLRQQKNSGETPRCFMLYGCRPFGHPLVSGDGTPPLPSRRHWFFGYETPLFRQGAIGFLGEVNEILPPPYFFLPMSRLTKSGSCLLSRGSASNSSSSSRSLGPTAGGTDRCAS